MAKLDLIYSLVRNDKNKTIKTLMWVLYFHVYYQVHSILNELQAPLTQDRIETLLKIHMIGGCTNQFARSLGSILTWIGMLKIQTMVLNKL